jgi:hypothetical protein
MWCDSGVNALAMGNPLRHTGAHERRNEKAAPESGFSRSAAALCEA